MTLPIFFDYADFTKDNLPFYPEDNLQAMFNDFLKITGLPQISAEDLIFEDLTTEQRQWISRFILLWQETEEKAKQ